MPKAIIRAYTMDEAGNPVPEPDIRKWVRWFDKTDLRIAFSEIGKASVSTSFLAYNHELGQDVGDWWDKSHKPDLFRTLITWPGHRLDQELQRYATRGAALQGHEATVTRVRRVQRWWENE